MIRKFKRWIDLFHEQETTLSECENGDPKDYGAAGELRHIEETVHDVFDAEATRTRSVPGCDNEQMLNGHSSARELEPNEGQGQNDLVVKNCVAENDVTNEANDPKGKGASCLDPSPEGKTSKTENDVVCQGATSWEKIGPDYPLFPLSRGFCLSLRRALESFQKALDKAVLKP